MLGAEDKVALEDVEAEEIIEVKSNRNQKMHLILLTTRTAEFLLRMSILTMIIMSGSRQSKYFPRWKNN